MIISIPHRFVFIAMPKCASTAVERALRPYASVFLGGTRLKHIKLNDFEDFLEPMLQANSVDVSSFEIYALFREPVSWLHSWWRYRMRPELLREKHAQSRFYTGGVSFDEFVFEYVKKRPAPFAWVGTQEQMITGKGGKLDRVLLFRYEEIETFIHYLENRIGAKLRLEMVNTSPSFDSEIPEAIVQKLRHEKPGDFRIYDAIPQRAVSITAAVNPG
jgi:hypothetical protein